MVTPPAPVEVDGQAEFSELIATHPLVLIEYHADWCGPCELLAPVLKSIAADPGTVVGKVDIEENGELALAHRVRRVPLLEVYHHEKRVDRFIGGRSERELRESIQQYLPDAERETSPG